MMSVFIIFETISVAENVIKENQFHCQYMCMCAFVFMSLQKFLKLQIKKLFIIFKSHNSSKVEKKKIVLMLVMSSVWLIKYLIERKAFYGFSSLNKWENERYVLIGVWQWDVKRKFSVRSAGGRIRLLRFTL